MGDIKDGSLFTGMQVGGQHAHILVLDRHRVPRKGHHLATMLHMKVIQGCLFQLLYYFSQAWIYIHKSISPCCVNYLCVGSSCSVQSSCQLAWWSNKSGGAHFEWRKQSGKKKEDKERKRQEARGKKVFIIFFIVYSVNSCNWFFCLTRWKAWLLQATSGLGLNIWSRYNNNGHPALLLLLEYELFPIIYQSAGTCSALFIIISLIHIC